MRAGTILREPLVVQGIGSAQEQQQPVEEMLDHVGLPGWPPSDTRTSSRAASGSGSGSQGPMLSPD